MCSLTQKKPMDDGHLAGGASCGCRSCASVRRCDCGLFVSEDVKYVSSKTYKISKLPLSLYAIICHYENL